MRLSELDDRPRAQLAFWFRAAIAVVLFTALVAFFVGFFRAKFYGVSGSAQWIWIDQDLGSANPVAFFAIKDIDVPAGAPYVRVKVACDSECTVYFNGREVGGAVAGARPTMDVFDVSEIAHRGGANRLVVAMRSANGVGGLLAAVDYAPLRENSVVSDGSWRIFTEWSEGLVERDPPRATMARTRVLGPPPFGRWNYVALRRANRAITDARRIEPKGPVNVSIPVPRIRVAGGVALASSPLEPASAWEFAEAWGRCVIEIAPGSRLRSIRLRYAANLDDLRSEGPIREIAVAHGERRIVDPQVTKLRVVATLDPGIRVAMLPAPVPAEQRRSE